MNKTINNLLTGFEQIKQMDLSFDVEVWKPIDGYYNYEISSRGRVMNVKKGKLLKSFLKSDGYLEVYLCLNSKKTHKSIHRLVANAFITPKANKLLVDHVNGDKNNNNIKNLRWVNKKENAQNCKLSLRNSSGTKGVTYDKSRKKWKAHICVDYKHVFIGRFDNKDDAIKARQNKAKELYGEYINKCEL